MIATALIFSLSSPWFHTPSTLVNAIGLALTAMDWTGAEVLAATDPTGCMSESDTLGRPHGAEANVTGLLQLRAMRFAGFSLALPDLFATPKLLKAMMFRIPELGLLSLATAIPLISGQANLAIIATTNRTTLRMGWVRTTQMPAGAEGAALWTWPVVAVPSGVVLRHVTGFLTGAKVARLGVHPNLVTLETMTLINGVSTGLKRLWVRCATRPRAARRHPT